VGSGGKIARSTDNGVTWTSVTNITSGSDAIFGIAYGNNTFVAVAGNGKIAYASVE
jgi:hypothetical protein